MKYGSHLKNMHFNYIPTYTGPGHASIYTGTTPSIHGIIANDWLERSSNQTVNCVGDHNVKGIESSSIYGSSSPHRLNTNTVTDQLKNDLSPIKGHIDVNQGPWGTSPWRTQKRRNVLVRLR